MPKLENLEIFGFKSFADKTQVQFDAGVTAIVGPNGCGKSNISDAINWVVGEQSAKSLRADKMEDVIFNGSGKRKALSFTEVTLQLRDYERLIPGENGDTEIRQVEPVSITRRMYRSGESEYYINERHCRLKDIYELFEGTGLGHNSYALIEQGRIDQILSAKPQDRRALIEEAAKVSVFKSRKKAAEIKLEMAQQNLLRINDIIGEVRRQADSLRRQAAKARRYGRLREELRQLHRTRIYLEFQKFHAHLVELNSQIEQLFEQDRSFVQQSRQCEALRSRLHATQEDLEKRIQNLRDALSRIDVDTERAEQQKRFQTQQIEEARRRGVEAKEREANITSRILSLEDCRLECHSQLEGARKRLQDSEQEADGICAQLDAIQQALERTQQEIESLRRHAVSHADELAQFKNEAVRLSENRANLTRQNERLRLEQERLHAEKAQLQEKLHAGAAQLSQTEQEGMVLRENEEQLKGYLADLGIRQVEAEQELSDLSEEYLNLRHRMTSLEEIETRHSNYSEGMQKFLNSVPAHALRVSGTVADLVEANPEYEGIIEDYLNEQLQYVVVDTLSEAIKGVEHVREIKAGKCTFMSLHGINGHALAEHADTSLKPSADAGLVARLKDELRMEPSLERALRRVFPDLSSTYIVRDMDAAVRLSHEHQDCAFLTLAGEYLSARGLLSAIGERKGAAGLLSLRREKRDLLEKIGRLRQQVEEARSRAALLRALGRDHQEVLLRSQREVHQSELERTRLEQSLISLRQELERLQQSESAARYEEERIAAEFTHIEKRHTEIEASILEMENTSQSSENTIADKVVQLGEQQRQKETAGTKLAEVRMDMAKQQERALSLDRECERYAQEHSDLEAQRLAMANTAAEAEATVQRLGEANRILAEELARLGEGRTTQSTAWQELLEAHQKTKQDVSAQEQEMEQLRSQRDSLREKISDLEVERARVETELEALNRGCLEEFHMPSQQLVAAFSVTDPIPALPEIESRYADVRSKVENFGAINMSALEEFQALEERLQLMLSQQADIQNSIATTLKTIEEINRHAVQQFQEAFSRINGYFAEVFNLLFSGGHAEMRLLDEADPMDSGIEVIASPPGKRLQNIMLLSGGEKALTALALLMGIFKFRPGPFCVLDEVDAPLDDANVQRFTNMLTQMSKNTQFIVITHNKRTLEAAQYLYGVTMQEPGVSKIVSVRFN